MSQSDKVDLLFSALVKVQAELRGAKKDSANPFFKSTYADLESCWSAAREPLTKNGLCVIQTTGIENGESGVITTLGHTSGQWVRGFLPLSMEKKDPQKQGSAITYARRYTLAAIIGLIQVDDDGESAMDRGPQGKGMIEGGNGVQREGFVMPQMPKGFEHLTKKYLEDIHHDDLCAVATAMEEKYPTRDKMPQKAGELYERVCNRIIEIERGASA